MSTRLKAMDASPHLLSTSNAACIAALVLVTLLPATALALQGDMNCDGAVNPADIPLFVDALLATGSFGGCDISRADMNSDGLINGRDTQPFVAALIQPHCIFPFTPCNGTCVDTTSDRNNCGGCGVQCGDTEACINGFCESG